MCGRFSLVTTPEELDCHFNLRRKVTVAPRYNIGPTENIVIILPGPGRNITSSVRWGLIPHWAKDMKIGQRLINARAETLQDKPAFREAFKSRRCLVPASGFFEWKAKGKWKQPYFIKMKNGGLFAMAGIWESWISENVEIESCAIITTDANTIVGKIHDRMPVIIPQDSYGLWLDKVRDGYHFREYFQPFTPFKMTAYPVSNIVNDVGNDFEECIKRID
jgi:putative SOS response-associated peptidase YedK